MAIRIGTSGWDYDHWRTRFYPEDLPKARWLRFYSRQFDTAEINNTFYHQPKDNVFHHWRDQVPDGFLFAVKANRYLTHFRKLKDIREPLDRFLMGVRCLKDRLGPILYQLPPHWRRNLDRLRQFAQLLPDDLIHVVEFRDRDWLCDETYDVMAEYNLSLCIHDLLPRHPRRVIGLIGYIRFHGAGKAYCGKYRPGRLRRWADWIRQIAVDRDVFAYFNNDYEAHACRDAQTLLRFVTNNAD